MAGSLNMDVTVLVARSASQGHAAGHPGDENRAAHTQVMTLYSNLYGIIHTLIIKKITLSTVLYIVPIIYTAV